MPRTKLSTRTIDSLIMSRTIRPAKSALKSCLKKKKRFMWAKVLTEVHLIEKIGKRKVKKRKKNRKKVREYGRPRAAASGGPSASARRSTPSPSPRRGGIYCAIAVGLIGWSMCHVFTGPLKLPPCPCAANFYGSNCDPCPNNEAVHVCTTSI